MKKLFLSFAVMAAFGASAAQAADDVKVYGVIDAGVVSESGPVRTNKVSSGVQSESRIGFKGQEDLGGGLKAVFVLEGALQGDTGGSADGGKIFGRQSFVGLSSDFGTLTVGRQLSSTYNVLHEIGDPFHVGLAGSAGNLFSIGSRSLDNSVRFASRDFGGLSGEVTYGAGEIAGTSAANRTIGASIGYKIGKADLRVAYDNAHDDLDINTKRTALVAGSYDFGFIKANAAYGTNDGTGIDSADYLIGGSVPFGPGAFTASYVRTNDRTVANHDASQWGIGYEYAMSKRTNLYSSYAHIKNENGAAFTVGNASEAGTGDRAFNIGVRHMF